MTDQTRIEVYEWPEGSTRSTDVQLELIEGDRTAPVPSVGDIFTLPAPAEAVTDGTVDTDEFYVGLGFAKAYRVVAREMLYIVRPRAADLQTPLKFMKVCIFVRALTKEEYWGTEP